MKKESTIIFILGIFIAIILIVAIFAEWNSNTYHTREYVEHTNRLDEPGTNSFTPGYRINSNGEFGFDYGSGMINSISF